MGKEMGFGEKEGQEFGEGEIALITIVELHVPNEFVVGGHVVVGDHAAVPPAAELHAHVAPDEVMGAGGGGDRVRGRWKLRVRGRMRKRVGVRVRVGGGERDGDGRGTRCSRRG